jgi:uncharacterized protein YchJ
MSEYKLQAQAVKYYKLHTGLKIIQTTKATETASSVSFIDMYLKFDRNGQLSTRSGYKRHKRDDFNFAIIKFPHHDCNIPIAVSDNCIYFGVLWGRKVNQF